MVYQHDSSNVGECVCEISSVEPWRYEEYADSTVLLLDGTLEEVRSLVERRVDKVEAAPGLVRVERVPLRLGRPVVRARIEEALDGRR